MHPDPSQELPPPNEKELPPPHEKQLSSSSSGKGLPPPTFLKNLNWKGFFIALIIVGVLEWGAITLLKGESTKKTPNPTPAPTLTQPSPTIVSDPTTNWQTYSDNQLGISFKYPETWKVSGDLVLAVGPDLPRVYIEPFTGNTETKIEKKFLSANSAKITKKTLAITPYKATEYFIQYDKSAQGFGPTERVVIIIESENQKAMLDSYGTADSTFYQIYYTFKFLPASPSQGGDQSPSPTCRPRPACLDATPRCLIPETPDMCPPIRKTVCTQDAKLCPDGSYVGRTGPNCEFASCPR